MGAHFRLAVQSLDWGSLQAILKAVQEQPLHTYLADVSCGLPYTEADFRSPLALIIGSEAEGAGEKAKALADEHIQIPMPGGSESLNAAVAAAVLMFEVIRQRSL
jgi:TrmH family RNA methyltransferase